MSTLATNNALLPLAEAGGAPGDLAVWIDPAGNEANITPWSNNGGHHAINSSLSGNATNGLGDFANFGIGSSDAEWRWRSMAGTNSSGCYIDNLSFGSAFTIVIDLGLPNANLTRFAYDSRPGSTGLDTPGIRIQATSEAGANLNSAQATVNYGGSDLASMSIPADPAATRFRFAVRRDGASVQFIKWRMDDFLGKQAVSGTLTHTGAFGLQGEPQIQLGCRPTDTATGNALYGLWIYDQTALSDAEIEALPRNVA